MRRDKTLRAVVVSGEGDAFCAGLDFASVMRNPAGLAKAFVPRPLRGTNTFQEAPWAFRRIPVPVIAAVHGHCLGGGLQIALAADFRIATPDSRWSVLEGKWGLIPDMSGIQALKELVGIDQAKAADHDRRDLRRQPRPRARPRHPPRQRPAQRCAAPGQRDQPQVTRRRGRRQATVQRHLERLAAPYLRPGADRAGPPARRPQHQGGPRGGVQEGRGGLRPARSLKAARRHRSARRTLALSPHPWGGRATAGSDPAWRP
nr:enoyl-CoA hydratase-related protein [Nocardioides convexus]